MTTAHHVARTERALLCDAFEQLGPDEPTLCEGWRTRDLAAHLVIRESRPDAAPGMFIPALRRHLDRVMQSEANKPWPQLVAAVRTGPPLWSPLRAVEGMANVVEFVVHREDVLRAQPTARIEDRDTSTLAVIWQRVRMSAPLMFRRDTVEIKCPGFGSWQSRGVHNNAATVTIQGSPVDVLLLATGRPHGCTITGDDAARAVFESRRRAI